MGWCSEFGCRIEPRCDHPMVAGRQSCSCEVCGQGCSGRFAGCAAVWAAGPKPRPARKASETTGVGGLGPIAVLADVPPPSPSTGSDSRIDDDRLRSLNDTMDRMGRQLRSVVKHLNQQPTASVAPDEDRLVALGETVERMGRELRGVLNLLIQQQATLVRLTDRQVPPLVADRPVPAAPNPQHRRTDAPTDRPERSIESRGTGERPSASLPDRRPTEYPARDVQVARAAADAGGAWPAPLQRPHGLGDGS